MVLLPCPAVQLVKQGEVERRTFTNLALSPDAASMPVNDPLHYCQADTGAGKIANGMKPLECAKEFMHIGHVKANSVVTNVVNRGAVQLGCAKLDPSRRMLAGKFPGIAE